MSVIETLTADPHRECRDRADALTGNAWRASLEQELKTARDAVSRARREATA
jgi:hypothetical protein